MKTYEMVALAEKDGCTYKSNGDMKYSTELGFHDSNVEAWPTSAWERCGLQKFVLLDGWRKLDHKKLTKQQISEILGYDFEIVG